MSSSIGSRCRHRYKKRQYVSPSFYRGMLLVVMSVLLLPCCTELVTAAILKERRLRHSTALPDEGRHATTTATTTEKNTKQPAELKSNNEIPLVSASAFAGRADKSIANAQHSDITESDNDDHQEETNDTQEAFPLGEEDTDGQDTVLIEKDNEEKYTIVEAQEMLVREAKETDDEEETFAPTHSPTAPKKTKKKKKKPKTTSAPTSAPIQVQAYDATEDATDDDKAANEDDDSDLTGSTSDNPDKIVKEHDDDDEATAEISPKNSTEASSSASDDDAEIIEAEDSDASSTKDVEPLAAHKNNTMVTETKVEKNATKKDTKAAPTTLDDDDTEAANEKTPAGKHAKPTTADHENTESAANKVVTDAPVTVPAIKSKTPTTAPSTAPTSAPSTTPTSAPLTISPTRSPTKLIIETPGFEPETAAATTTTEDGNGDTVGDSKISLESEEAVEQREKKEELKAEEQVAKKIGGWVVFGALFAMIFTAYQMSENPDGVYASICRLAITLSTCIIKLVLLPCKKLFGNRFSGYAHHLIPIDYSESYRGRNSHVELS